MNPLFNSNVPQTPQMQMISPMNFIQQFNQFRQMFRGNPQQQVQQLLNSGQMTQEQFEQYKSTAQQMMNMFR